MNAFLRIICSIMALLVLAAGAVALFDPEYGSFVIMQGQSAAWARGKELYREKGCGTCHGKDGNKPVADSYPRIGGQNADYVVQQLRDFKSGARSNAAASLMQAAVKELSEEELASIAAYLRSP